MKPAKKEKYEKIIERKNLFFSSHVCEIRFNLQETCVVFYSEKNALFTIINGFFTRENFFLNDR